MGRLVDMEEISTLVELMEMGVISTFQVARSSRELIFEEAMPEIEELVFEEAVPEIEELVFEEAVPEVEEHVFEEAVPAKMATFEAVAVPTLKHPLRIKKSKRTKRRSKRRTRGARPSSTPSSTLS